MEDFDNDDLDFLAAQTLAEHVADELRDEVERLRAENEALRKDAERLDWLDKNVTMVSDSERYLPRRVYWGGGTNKNVRQAIDAARQRTGDNQ